MRLLRRPLITLHFGATPKIFSNDSPARTARHRLSPCSVATAVRSQSARSPRWETGASVGERPKEYRSTFDALASLGLGSGFAASSQALSGLGVSGSAAGSEPRCGYLDAGTGGSGFAAKPVWRWFWVFGERPVLSGGTGASSVSTTEGAPWGGKGCSSAGLPRWRLACALTGVHGQSAILNLSD